MQVTLNAPLQYASTDYAVRKTPQGTMFNVQNQVNQAEIPETKDHTDDIFLIGLVTFTAACISAITLLTSKKQPPQAVKSTALAVIPTGAEAKSLPKTNAEKAVLVKQIKQLRETLAYITKQPERAAEKSSKESVEMIERRLNKLTNRLIYA